jgi:hypothetical protein
MFRKKDEELQIEEPQAPREETAYEDNWYRSLKAMREQQAHEEPEPEEGFEADGPTEASAEGEPGEVPDDALPDELQARAGELLERLRTLQHLSEDEQPEPEPEPKSSVWG